MPTGSHSVPRRAVCLVSGGMDSAVVLAEARAAGFELFALSFAYGQRHRVELEAAARVAAALGVREHRTVTVDLRALGGSALTDDVGVPKDRAADAIGGDVPVTYVPARNTVFLSIALGWAEVLGAHDLFVGVNAVDYSGYPDCRPEFLRAFEDLARLATAEGAERGAAFTVHAPLMELTKADIVRRAARLDVDLGLTHTCYDPARGSAGEVMSCGRCDACRLRLAGFREAGVSDPIVYAPNGALPSVLDGVDPNADALRYTGRLCEEAVAAGFHWKDARGALGKLEEELDELREVLPEEALTRSAQPDLEPSAEERVRHELGDVLLAAAFLGGYLKLDPEQLCRTAAERFERRYRHMEASLGGTLDGHDLKSMMAAWTRAKRATDATH